MTVSIQGFQEKVLLKWKLLAQEVVLVDVVLDIAGAAPARRG